MASSYIQGLSPFQQGKSSQVVPRDDATLDMFLLWTLLPTSSLVWADVILADFQRVVSRYLQDIST